VNEIVPADAADIYKEQGSFQIVPLSKLPPNLGTILSPALLNRIDKYQTMDRTQALFSKQRAQRAFVNLATKHKAGLGRIPTLIGGLALSSIVPLLLDTSIPLGVVDAESEVEALAGGGAIGYISASGQRHIAGAGMPTAWYRQVAEDDIYMPLK
jgi:hypothetical protein